MMFLIVVVCALLSCVYIINSVILAVNDVENVKLFFVCKRILNAFISFMQTLNLAHRSPNSSKMLFNDLNM